MPPDILEDGGNNAEDQGKGKDQTGDPDIDMEIGGKAAGDAGDDRSSGLR